MSSMQGRIALVTGASSGIGLATAEHLAREGASVALVALPGDALESAAQRCRGIGPVVAVGVDLTDSTQVREAFDAAEALGPVTAVFSNSGMSTVAPVIDTTDEQWRRQLDVNLSSGFYVCREAARRMLSRGGGGAIVTTASELAHLGQGGYAAYTATKGGLLSMTRALAAELAVHRIRVNSVSPGAVDTPLLAAEFAAASDPASERAENEASVALGRIGAPLDIAAAVTFLLSDSADYITGANLLVDGGRASCFAVGSIARGG